MFENLKAKKLQKIQDAEKNTWTRLDQLMSDLTKKQEDNETFIEYLRLRENVGV